MNTRTFFNIRTFFIVLASILLTSTTATAHPIGPASAGGLLAGFAHPWLGLDHLLATFLVGLLSIKMADRFLWILPASFFGVISLGIAIGTTGLQFHGIEPMLAASVVVLGAVLAAAARRPNILLVAMVAVIGLLHGHVHGTELPAHGALLYAAGLLAAMVTIQLLGMTIGKQLLSKKYEDLKLRIVGCLATCAGLLLLVLRI